MKDVTPALQELHRHNAPCSGGSSWGVPGSVIALLALAPLPRGREALALGFSGAGLIIAMLNYDALQARRLYSLWLGASFIAATATAPAEDKRPRGEAE